MATETEATSALPKGSSGIRSVENAHLKKVFTTDQWTAGLSLPFLKCPATPPFG